MKVVLSTIGRFHFFDLARQLQSRSVLERIFCGYPSWKLRHEGIPMEKIDTYPWWQVPYMAMGRSALLAAWRDRAFANRIHRTFDRHVSRSIPECDIFHGLSRYNLEAGRVARKKGARYICDVGSSHILFQEKILREEHEMLGLRFPGFHAEDVERELQEYEESDQIVIPSQFSFRTFVERGVDPEKISRIPYGVDLRNFSPQPCSDDGIFRVVFVGGLTIRKGIHYLAQAFRDARIPNSQLVLIGSGSKETDLLLEPVRGLNVLRVGHQPQSAIAGWFSRSSVSVLPSIEDGYGIVILQSLACGCPVIASRNTGGAECIDDGKNGFLVPIRSAASISDRLRQLHEQQSEAARMRKAAEEYVHRIGGWQTYGTAVLGLYERLTSCVPEGKE